ncbi:MAG: hypothetical protein ACLFR8_06545 [Alkalispirochaeta sp.]
MGGPDGTGGGAGTSGPGVPDGTGGGAGTSGPGGPDGTGGGAGTGGAGGTSGPGGPGGTTRGASQRRRVSPSVLAFLVLYGTFVVAAFLFEIPFGIAVGTNFGDFAREMVFVVPAAFVLIGLFEVWVPRATVERHLGEKGSRPAQWFWMLMLAGTAVGGLYVAFPIAAALHRKGARLGAVLSYIGLSGVSRIPMTLFEISFLGVPFTLIRYFVSVPLVILSSELLGTWLERRGFKIADPG